jgi:hypothetical protein
MVRPESILISHGDRDSGFLGGEVLQTAFLGNCTRVAVACDDCRDPVLAELHGAEADGLDELRPGRRVRLSWRSASAVAIDDPESSPEPCTGPDTEEEEVRA